MSSRQIFMEAKTCFGRGGWSWYTGSASWYYRCGIEYILGMTIQDNHITLTPCVPDEWEEYSIQYRYRSSIYNIHVDNTQKTNQVQELKMNGETIAEKKIKLQDNNTIYNVDVII